MSRPCGGFLHIRRAGVKRKNTPRSSDAAKNKET
nr:MAG TPA: hypothetical protein [Caudoviricetes sp.]DAO90005.1 MAG TPA: hypothetical protein [Caudoviricetes sp.]